MQKMLSSTITLGIKNRWLKTKNNSEGARILDFETGIVFQKQVCHNISKGKQAQEKRKGAGNMFAVLVTTGCSFKDGKTEKQFVVGIDADEIPTPEYFDRYTSGSMTNEEFEDWTVNVYSGKKPFSVRLCSIEDGVATEITLVAEEMENLEMLLG